MGITYSIRQGPYNHLLSDEQVFSILLSQNSQKCPNMQRQASKKSPSSLAHEERKSVFERLDNLDIWCLDKQMNFHSSWGHTYNAFFFPVGSAQLAGYMLLES